MATVKQLQCQANLFVSLFFGTKVKLEPTTSFNKQFGGGARL